MILTRINLKPKVENRAFLEGMLSYMYLRSPIEVVFVSCRVIKSFVVFANNVFGFDTFFVLLLNAFLGIKLLHLLKK